MPASAAATMPSEALPVVTVTAKAVTAPDQHHALDAEVEDARALDHELAERGEQQRRRGADDGQQRPRTATSRLMRGDLPARRRPMRTR